jgi:SAM-dependent methyltransferase
VDAPAVNRALSFGRGAADYDRVRPEYSPEALDLVTARLGLGRGAEVLDLGAGTGKLTRPLVERFARVTAIEPDPGMRAVLGQLTGCCLDGRAEAIPLADRSVDAVFVGQAFHWFATQDAVREIARVLRPKGGLVLIWNTWWDPDPPLPDAASELIKGVLERKQLEPVNLRKDDWRDCFRVAPFEELHQEDVPVRLLAVDAEHLVTLYLSTSPFGVLPPDERSTVEAELRRLITGRYRLPVGTRVYWTRLT